MNGLNRIAHGFGKLGNLVAGIGGVAAAVIEEKTDVVRAKNFDQPLVFAAIGFQALEFVAAGAECAGRRVA